MMRHWVSPNGVTHLIPEEGRPCATCGRLHPTVTELASGARAMEQASALFAALGAGDWDAVHAAADWLRDEAALLRAAAKERGGADWLRAGRGHP